MAIAEFLLFVLTATLGGMFLCGANDLITIFVAPECFSLCSYLLSGYTKKDVRSNEATTKYLLMGGASSSILVHGFSWLYGSSGGEIELQEIVNGLINTQMYNSPGISIALIFITVGIGFKLSPAPSHQWTPDVYEGVRWSLKLFGGFPSSSASTVSTSYTAGSGVGCHVHRGFIGWNGDYFPIMDESNHLVCTDYSHLVIYIEARDLLSKDRSADETTYAARIASAGAQASLYASSCPASLIGGNRVYPKRRKKANRNALKQRLSEFVRKVKEFDRERKAKKGRSSVPEPIRCPLLKKPPIPRTTTMAAKSAAYSTSTARMPHLRAYSCAAYSD
ncbi:hypothetical protein V6N11_014128 [Hibiscus sabdariffa]|uniref:NADH:quinone oxidoreductase/Mrp antiporter transmembrane domain-containing protein n=1 Tax=Hibiscus sabdariffa TaxID=183260 RepID=A0ABR2AFP4_9ROSI